MAKTAKKGDAKAAAPKEKALPQKKVRVRNQVKKGPHGGTLIVLVDDTAHVGKQGEVVEVRPGYARNYLIPYGKAVIPNAENLRTLEQYKIKVEPEMVRLENPIKEANTLTEVPLSLGYGIEAKIQVLVVALSTHTMPKTKRACRGHNPPHALVATPRTVTRTRQT